MDYSSQYIRSTYIKIYGAERTFTNYAKFLIERNFTDTHVLVHVFGWKHGPFDHSQFTTDPLSSWVKKWFGIATGDISKPSFPYDLVNDAYDQFLAGQLRFFFTVKNPYAWYSSYAKFRKHPYPYDTDKIKRAIKKYNQVYTSYLKLCEQAKRRYARVWRYEDLLQHGVPTFLDQVESFYELPDRSDCLVDSDRNIQSGGVILNAKPFRRSMFDRSYYANREYLKLYTQEQLDTISQHVTPYVLGGLGYDPI